MCVCVYIYTHICIYVYYRHALPLTCDPPMPYSATYAKRSHSYETVWKKMVAGFTTVFRRALNTGWVNPRLVLIR